MTIKVGLTEMVAAMEKIVKFTKTHDYDLKYWYRFDGANFETKHATGIYWSKAGMERLAWAHNAQIQLTDYLTGECYVSSK